MRSRHLLFDFCHFALVECEELFFFRNRVVRFPNVSGDAFGVGEEVFQLLKKDWPAPKKLIQTL